MQRLFPENFWVSIAAKFRGGASTGPKSLDGKLKAIKNLKNFKNKTRSRIIRMDQIEKICERLELGEPLSTICKDKEDARCLYSL